MAGNWGGKREGAGRPIGSRNTHSKNMVLEARRTVAEARAQGRKLAKEVADDFMHIFASMALECRPVTAREIERGAKPNPKADENKFRMLSAILLNWVSVLIPYQSARFQQVKFDVGVLADGPDGEEVGAMATLERLLDAYAQADEEERRIRAARDEEERRFREARTVADEQVEPAPSDEPKLEPSDKLVVLRPRGQ
jgi:hypothetical protein